MTLARVGEEGKEASAAQREQSQAIPLAPGLGAPAIMVERGRLTWGKT